VDDAADPLQFLAESVMICLNWLSMALPLAVPYLPTTAALIWAGDMLADAGATETTAIAFSNDMSRSKYPVMQESWLEPSEPDAATNLLTSALVQCSGADLALPPHAVTVSAVTAAASGQVSRG
jgi:hypothetical protein